MIMHFLFSFIGYIVSYRIFLESMKNISLAKNKAQIFVKINVVLALMDAISFFISIQWGFFFLFIQVIFYKSMPWLLNRYLESKLASIRIDLLDQILLSLQSGKDFKFSVREAIDFQPQGLRLLLNDIYIEIFLNEKSNMEVKNRIQSFFVELKEIAYLQTKVAENIRHYRSQLRLQEKFRHKSGQITLQARIQAGLMAMLYFSLLIFVINYFEWHQHKKIIVGSFICFVVGQTLILNIGRSYKWKM
ncbi:MAG: hypothetical protein ACOYOK_03370 [Pseudobdellovibrionaceae bacterium]